VEGFGCVWREPEANLTKNVFWYFVLEFGTAEMQFGNGPKTIVSPNNSISTVVLWAGK
jgi:hypothetical protein